MTNASTVTSSNLGFPRIGAQRELKKALESYWKGDLPEAELVKTAQTIRATNWKLQQAAGIAHIPSNDFSYYDQVLDTTAMVGNVPARYRFSGAQVDLATYFAMARGTEFADGTGAPAMEMTKWFDTNYHYLVPEFSAGQSFKLASTKAVDEFNEAKAQGITTRPVLLGPVSYLLLGKLKGGNALDLLPALLPVYTDIIGKLEAAGAEWIQIDEPCLVLDLDAKAKAAYTQAFAELSKGRKAKFLLATYFGDLQDNLALAFSLPVAAVHLDLVRAPQQLDQALATVPADKALSLGVINGRNIWRANLDDALTTVQKAVAKLGAGRVFVGPSCSMLHSPVDLSHETKLDAELKNWLAFAAQKVEEIAAITKAANGDAASVKAAFDASRAAAESRKTSPRIHNPKVKERLAGVKATDYERNNPFAKRVKAQQAHLNLPLLPTTTIGSFPQTAEVRAARAEFKAGKRDAKAYDAFLEQETIQAVRYQDEIGIDVLVHGEFERNDMVEYFGEQLSGFTFTQNGWVQSYGSRCVKPPVIFGDVERPNPMTVRWSAFAQSLTKTPMKGMLTGPVTILQWSFVRDDQPREATCKQIGLAIRDEVVDLEKAGISIIQIDEPAIREGLPLRRAEWNAYLRWAVDSFRLSAAGVRDETQIHTHMCYSEFNDIMPSIAEMDADVISIETSRSHMELLEAFVTFQYPNQIGPGVYDIHSPRVPSEAEMEALLRKALDVLAPEQVWVNPDCGLKTRGWKEVKPALEKMVGASRKLRAELEAAGKKAVA